jgi:class 3 adenylate cyclase/tetratricopeptide (TPR) repeat protein
MVGAAGSVPGSEIDLIPSRLAEAAASPKAAREGERKQVSVLFCDIANSTRLADELGADRMHGVVNEFFENALTQIRRFEGTINVFLGDGFMALFGEPFAYEDHARRAALAGLAIQDMLKERTSAFLPADKSLSVRIGINSGAVVVGKVGDNLRWDYTAIGDTTNVAARLQAEAEPGTIACSEAVARAIVNNVDCRPLGMRALKGKPEPVPVYQVVRARSGTARSPDAATPIVGRHEILTDIRAAVDRAASGKGGILGVVGEAGIGKSRLLAEARSFASERGLRWIEGSGLSFGGMLSYWPFRELVRACFEIAEDDDEHLCWSRLRVRMVDLLGPEQGEELVPYIGVLLSLPIPDDLAGRTRALDGLSMGHQIFRAMLKLFERLGQERPMVVAFEDWHWADASSADLLEHLLSLAATTPILYLVASRPAQDGAWEKLRTAIVSDARLSPHYREFALAPLADDDVTRLIAHLLGGGTLPVAIRAVLLRRASGNPFFLGELIRALQASRVLEKDPATGAWIATGPFDPSLLPDSVEGVILARIDRLEDEAKQVLKVAAVVGRSFFYRVLSSITEGATSLDANLAKLVRSEFIDCRRQLPELEYMFKHPLIQQASYRSLLAERRRLLHKRAGETIEQLFQARLEEFYSLLAYHFAQAEHWAKAHEYLLKAADHAGGMAADAEALELYQQALDASERSTQAQVTALTRAELDFKIGEALYRSGKQEQAVGFLRQALRRLGIDFPLARSDIKSATVRELIRCLPALLMHGPNAKAPPDVELTPEQRLQFRIFETLSFTDYFSEPQRVLLDMLLGFKAVRAKPRSPEYVVTMGGLGLAFNLLGLRWLSGRCNARAFRFAEEIGGDAALASCYLFQGLEQEHDGKSDQSVRTLRKAVDLYLQAGDLRRWKTALKGLLILLRNRGDRSWIGLNNQILQLFTEMQDPHSEAWAGSGRGHEELMKGNFAGAAEVFARISKVYEQVPDYRTLAQSLCEWGRCEFHLGHVDEALGLVRRGSALVEEHQMRGFNATGPVMTTAEVFLMAAEASSAEERAKLLEDARKACAAATQHARLTRDYGAAESIRLRAVLAWIENRPAEAETLWNEAAQLAQRLGAKPVLANVHLDLGRRLGRHGDLDRARKLLEEIGATMQLDAAWTR